MLAPKRGSARGEQLGRERQLLTFIFNLWLGKDVTNIPSSTPLQDLEHFFRIILFKAMFNCTSPIKSLEKKEKRHDVVIRIFALDTR